MKYNRSLIKKAYEHKEKVSKETKELIEKLIEAYNESYVELRDTKVNVEELNSIIKDITKQKRKKRRKTIKKVETENTTKTIFFGG